MAKYIKFVHPRYNWYDTILKEIGEEVYLTPNGEIKQSLPTYTEEDEKEAKPGHVYGIIEDNGSFEIEFRNSLYKYIEEYENTICSSKLKIARLKELGGIQ